MNNYNLREVFTIAEEIEDNGAAFYCKAAEIFKDNEEIHKLLKLLEEEEKYHGDIFRRYKEMYAADSEYYDDLDETSRKYINSLASQYVFNKKNHKNELIESSSKADVFDFAIEREKDAILFYLGVKNTMNNQKDIDAVEVMIREEQRHLADLTTYRERYEYLLK